MRLPEARLLGAGPRAARGRRHLEVVHAAEAGAEQVRLLALLGAEDGGPVEEEVLGAADDEPAADDVAEDDEEEVLRERVGGGEKGRVGARGGI